MKSPNLESVGYHHERREEWRIRTWRWVSDIIMSEGKGEQQHDFVRVRYLLLSHLHISFGAKYNGPTSLWHRFSSLWINHHNKGGILTVCGLWAVEKWRRYEWVILTEFHAGFDWHTPRQWCFTGLLSSQWGRYPFNLGLDRWGNGEGVNPWYKIGFDRIRQWIILASQHDNHTAHMMILQRTVIIVIKMNTFLSAIWSASVEYSDQHDSDDDDSNEDEDTSLYMITIRWSIIT